MTRTDRRRTRLVVGSLLPALLLASAGCAHVPSALERIDCSEVSLSTVDGDPYPLGAQRGRVVLVTFFATWCFPCVVETEMLKHLAREHPRDLTVVSIGMDLEGRRVLKPFRDQFELPYPVLVADQATRAGTGPFGHIEMLPTTYLLDRAGRVRSAFTGVPQQDDLERIIAKLSDEPPPEGLHTGRTIPSPQPSDLAALGARPPSRWLVSP